MLRRIKNYCDFEDINELQDSEHFVYRLCKLNFWVKLVIIWHQSCNGIGQWDSLYITNNISDIANNNK